MINCNQDKGASCPQACKEKQELPDKMTGKDLVVQEEHESSLEKDVYDRMDRVDRRDKRDEIISFVANNNYRRNFDKINWGGNNMGGIKYGTHKRIIQV